MEILEEADQYLDWKEVVVCTKDDHISNRSLPPCGVKLVVVEKDLLLAYCFKKDHRYVAIECPKCNKIIEVSIFHNLPVAIQHRIMKEKSSHNDIWCCRS